MIVLLSALLMSGRGAEARTQSSLARDLAVSATRLAQAKGPAARIDELASVVIRLSDALAEANLSPKLAEDSVYYARLVLFLVEDGLLPRLREVTDDDPANDSRYSRATDAAARAVELSRSLLSVLPENQRARVRPRTDAVSPPVTQLQNWMKERMERHDKRTAPPDGTTPRREEKTPGGRTDVGPH